MLLDNSHDHGTLSQRPQASKSKNFSSLREEAEVVDQEVVDQLLDHIQLTLAPHQVVETTGALDHSSLVAS